MSKVTAEQNNIVLTVEPISQVHVLLKYLIFLVKNNSDLDFLHF